MEKMDKKFGATYTYCSFSTPRLVTTDPGLIRQMFVAQSDAFVMSSSSLVGARMLGSAVAAASGEFWKRQREVLSPIFYSDNVKVSFRDTHFA